MWRKQRAEGEPSILEQILAKDASIHSRDVESDHVIHVRVYIRLIERQHKEDLCNGTARGEAPNPRAACSAAGEVEGENADYKHDRRREPWRWR
jgi:hypothetical protein